MGEPNAEESNELSTPEEAAAYRQKVIDDMEAEDAGGSPPLEAAESHETLETDDDNDAGADADAGKKDPWAGVDPQLKTMFDDLSSENKERDERLKQSERRIGALTNQLSDAKKAAETVADAPSAEEMEAAKASTEKWEELKEDYPDWAEAIEGFVNAKSAGHGGITKEQLDEKLTELRTDMEGKTEREIQKAVLAYAHPNYQETIDSKGYQKWIGKQGEDVTSKLGSGQAIDAIGILDSYNETLETPALTAEQIAEQRKKRLSQSSSLTTNRKSKPIKSESDMSDAEYRDSYGDQVWAEP